MGRPSCTSDSAPPAWLIIARSFARVGDVARGIDRRDAVAQITLEEAAVLMLHRRELTIDVVRIDDAVAHELQHRARVAVAIGLDRKAREPIEVLERER